MTGLHLAGCQYELSSANHQHRESLIHSVEKGPQPGLSLLWSSFWGLHWNRQFWSHIKCLGMPTHAVWKFTFWDLHCLMHGCRAEERLCMSHRSHRRIWWINSIKARDWQSCIQLNQQQQKDRDRALNKVIASQGFASGRAGPCVTHV